MIWPFRRPTLHDIHGIVARRAVYPHGHALYVTRRVRVRDVFRLADADWRVEEVHAEGDLFWCRIGRLQTRVAA